jgi:hypothetical protein
MTTQFVHSLPANMRRVVWPHPTAGGWMFPTSMMRQLRIAYRAARADMGPLGARARMTPILARYGTRFDRTIEVSDR